MFFEIDDIKRRHAVYFDVYNVHGWIDHQDNKFGWDYARGVMAAVPALMLNEYGNLFAQNYRLLTQNYEPPRNLAQVGTYWKEVRKMDNFKFALKNRMQYAAMIGVFDVGLRLALWKYWTSGIWKSFGTFDIEFWRRITPTVIIGALTAPLSVPFEVARAAYYADRTYPKELQKGYKSIFDALRRIPSEEGPYYLTRGALPIMLRNYCSFTFLVYLYDFLNDKAFIFEDVAGIPRLITKSTIIAASTFFACAASMPWDVTVKHLAEMTPKIEGKHPFSNNYRKAAVFLWYYRLQGQYFHGFTSYCMKQAPWMATTLWLADSLGMFKVLKHNYMTNTGGNTYESFYR